MASESLVPWEHLGSSAREPSFPDQALFGVAKAERPGELTRALPSLDSLVLSCSMRYFRWSRIKTTQSIAPRKLTSVRIKRWPCWTFFLLYDSIAKIIKNCLCTQSRIVILIVFPSRALISGPKSILIGRHFYLRLYQVALGPCHHSLPAAS